jgi:protease PrsW
MSRARTLAATELLLIAGLLAFVGAAWAAERILGLTAPVHLSPLLSLALAAVPAALWLGYFYLQDRSEPEPKHYVAGVYLLGAFVAPPVASFLSRTLFPVAAASTTRINGANLIAAILSAGLAQELAKYLVVRYSIYLSAEFDEPMDGIIYMTAAGIGFATAENVHYLEGVDGTVFLATGAMNTVVTTLAHGCFAGVLGYVLGRARFSGVGPIWRNLFLLGGLLLAAGLNGTFSLLQRAVRVSGLQVHPWRGVAFAAGFAVLVFGAVWLLMGRAVRAPREAP